MKEVGIELLRAVGKIGVAFLVCACLVGGDTLIPHKYVVYDDDGNKYVTNKNPTKD